MRGPCEAEPKPVGPASEREHPGDESDNENVQGSYMETRRYLAFIPDTYKSEETQVCAKG